MSDGINAINPLIASSLYVATSTKIMTALKESTIRQLKTYEINVEEVTSEEAAQAIIEEKKAEKEEKIKTKENADTYYDKQIIADAIDLAQDLGIYVGSDTNIETLMDNIKNKLNEFSNVAGNNENMKNIANEYSNRYDYIYSQYINKKDFLSSQLLASLDAMSISSVNISS